VGVSDCLLVEREAGQVLITLNRPQALNSLSRELLTRLEEVVTELERAEDLRAVVITGAGEKAFCAGADIKELMVSSSAGDAIPVR
jgi:enoyl-CoA hydratase/carnithine racemase